mmetsp:Transcript_13940/g.56119  ORF Transcript_13940/g.56119 Transcript_13940/m.56119 type:complete len:368 (-) Transcript_13940:909-2012(-)
MTKVHGGLPSTGQTISSLWKRWEEYMESSEPLSYCSRRHWINLGFLSNDNLLPDLWENKLKEESSCSLWSREKMINSCFVSSLGVEKKRCRASMTCSKRVEELKPGNYLRSGTDVQFSESVLVPGKFDALHLGHRELVRHASALGSTVLVMTFPGMAEVLGWEPRKPTCSSKQREEIFNAWSEELSTNIYAVEIPFSKIRSLKPKEFIEFVVDDFNTSAIVCGNDWRFGYKAEGDVNMLKTICSEASLVADVVGAMSLDDEPISSSRVRRALDDGDMELVQRLLGRPHQLHGRFDLTKKVVSNLENSSPRTGLYRARISSGSVDCPVVVRIDRNEEATACIEIVSGEVPDDIGETVDVNIHHLLEAK